MVCFGFCVHTSGYFCASNPACMYALLALLGRQIFVERTKCCLHGSACVGVDVMPHRKCVQFALLRAYAQMQFELFWSC